MEVGVGLLGYGTVGAAVHRLLVENAEDIERATGHRLRVVRALVRDLDKERGFVPEPGILTTDAGAIRDDPAIGVVAEVMGGIEPARTQVLDLLAAHKPVVTANKQLVAQHGAELFAAAAAGGVQLRFEASVCAAIPVIKVLREALVVTKVHRVLGIVNGTTNFILTEMEGGATFAEALAEAQRLGYAEADPTDDVSGADAAAKMAILATVAFGSRVTLADVDYQGVEGVTPLHVAAARELEMVVRLVGSATLVDERLDVRVRPAFVDRHHPLAAVEGAFNAVMLQGDAIREITLEGPGAGGTETASAVVADMVSVIGTTANGFLQNDGGWRTLERASPGRAPVALLRPPRGRRPARRARGRGPALRGARGLGRPAHPGARRGRRRPPRRRARGRAERRRRSAGGDRAAPERARAALPRAGRLRSRRRRARLGLIGPPRTR